jgi:group I intron endonuclease
MFIYKTTNLVNGKIYIGKACNKSTMRNSYLGSGKYFIRALAKYGKDNFERRIIDFGEDRNDLCRKEVFWIKFYDARNSLVGYNICPGGEGGSGGDTLSAHPNREEIARKISLKAKERLKNKENHPMYGTHRSEETRSRISTSRMGQVSGFKGKKHSEETRSKMRLAQIGHIPWNKGLKMIEVSA